MVITADGRYIASQPLFFGLYCVSFAFSPSLSSLIFNKHQAQYPVPPPSWKMKSFAVISSLVAAVAAAGNCGGDNCARQVTGTRAGLLAITSRQADCSSFQQTTIVPDAT